MKKNMKARINEFLDSPITWRQNFKVAGILTAITIVGEAAYFGYYFRDEIRDCVEEAVNRLKRKEELPDVEYVEDEET